MITDMATTEKCIEMSNRLRSIKNSENPEVNHIIAGADDIYDDVLEKKQSELNEFIQATKEAVDELSPDQTEALALATDVVQLKEDVSQGAVYDVSAKNPTAGPNSDGKFANLDYVLSNADTLIPSGVRKGGMSIKFVQSSDNKYVQYWLMSASFSTSEADWQKYGEDFTTFSLLISDLFISNKTTLALPGIIGADGIYRGEDATSSSHIYIKLAEGDIVSITAKDNAGSVYCLLNSIQKSPTSNTADFIIGESRRTILAGETVSIVAPQNCYLYLTVLSSDLNYLPQEISINGNEYYPNPVETLKTEVSALSQNIKFGNSKYPKDYNVNGLSISDIFGLVTGETIKDISDIVKGRTAASTSLGTVGGDGTIQNKLLGYSHYIISVLPGQVIRFKPNSLRPTDFAVLRSYSPYIFTSSITGRQRYDAGSSEVTITLPNDAYFIALTQTYSNLDFSPLYFLVNGDDAINGTSSMKTRVENLEKNEVFHSVLSFNNSSDSFDFYSAISQKRYAKFTIKKVMDDAIVQNLWRLIGGNICDSSFNNICTSIYGGENEWAAAFVGFKSTEGFVGGFHGGEDCEGDNNCFVKFFADGKLIDSSSMSSDFELQCNVFEYIQYSTLHKVKTSSGDDIPGHPIFAHHVKHTIIKDGEMTCKNIVVFDTSVSIYEYFSGLFCTGKQVATNCILPSGISITCSGDSSDINATDKMDSEIIFYNPQNNTLVKVRSEYIRGIDVEANISNLVEKVWDRVNDSKYYRYIINNNGIAVTDGDIIETKTLVSFS